MTDTHHQDCARVATTAEIRAHFPALERAHKGQPVAYFDGPGGTQVPRCVGEAMVDYLYHHNANTDWAYPTSAETDAALTSARQAFADFVNASPDEIVFGANMTTLTFHLSRALGRGLSPGDEIIVTELDHHANIDPWRELARDRDLRLRTVRMIPETGQLDWDDFNRRINGRTKLVAVGAASNALGTISDVRAAAEMAHRAGALIFVDAVHYAPHSLPDVRAFDCDFLACSAYKFNGPHVGILYGRHDLLQSLDFPRLRPAHDTAPERGETGTLNHEGIVGAAAAVDFFASLNNSGETRRQRLKATFDEVHARGAILIRTLWEKLSAIDGVSLYGSPPGLPRTPTIAFTIDGMNSREVARLLADRGVFVSHGDFYASTVVERLGFSEAGLVRAGCAIYTTTEEVLCLVEGVRSISHSAAASRPAT
ncbi:MAG: cysteine desulfurase-like protein [Gemmatimonadaceae bacterium]|nr:cysteine desulfurase-like protein [Gemmatimonadaceae bacterium]